MPTQIFGYNIEVLLGSRSSTMALVDNIIYIFLSAACHHASASEQTFLVTLSASGSIETGKYWKLGGGGRGGKWDLWSLAAEKINKCHLIRPISVSQWGLSSRTFKLTLLPFKAKRKRIRGEGKRKEKCWRCWKSDRERRTAPAAARSHKGWDVRALCAGAAGEPLKGSALWKQGFLRATCPCPHLTGWR